MKMMFFGRQRNGGEQQRPQFAEGRRAQQIISKAGAHLAALLEYGNKNAKGRGWKNDRKQDDALDQSHHVKSAGEDDGESKGEQPVSGSEPERRGRDFVTPRLEAGLKKKENQPQFLEKIDCLID